MTAPTLRSLLSRQDRAASELARQIGVHRNTILGYLRGSAEPSLSVGAALAKALGVSVDEIVCAFAASRRSFLSQGSTRVASRATPRPSATRTAVETTPAARSRRGESGNAR